MSAGDQLKLWGALIAAIASLIVAMISHFSNRSNQRDIEHLRSTLQAADAERNAKRDYEYEARKRLYHECGPAFFQIMELSESALHRITGLARTAREGNLEPNGPSFLTDDYYWTSTLYRLLAVPAVVRTVQRRLTMIDLSLDRKMWRQYTLAREAFFSFSNDFTLAKLGSVPVLYDPLNVKAEEKAQSEPAIYWRQGLPSGVIEPAIEALLVVGHDGQYRLMSFPECEAAYEKKNSKVRREFDEIKFLVDEFHPRSRPIFWRMLVVQACLYRTLAKPSELDEDRWNIRSLQIPDDQRLQLDWRSSADVEVSNETVFEPLAIADRYFQQQLASRLTLIK
jgi:hypothetical protein